MNKQDLNTAKQIWNQLNQHGANMLWACYEHKSNMKLARQEDKANMKGT